MERDWTLELMLQICDAFERDRTTWLHALDRRLDDLGMRLQEFTKENLISGLQLRRGLNAISRLRGELESAQTPAEVRDCFTRVEDLRDLVAQAEATMKER